jgi:DNA-directed RNA polymerase subunit omega
VRYPSIDKLLEIVDSKYRLALIISKRAKAIDQGAPVLLEKTDNVKPVGIALEELISDKLIIK